MSETHQDPDKSHQERSTFWEAFLFFSLTLVLSGVGTYLMADYL